MRSQYARSCAYAGARDLPCYPSGRRGGGASAQCGKPTLALSYPLVSSASSQPSKAGDRPLARPPQRFPFPWHAAISCWPPAPPG
mmetsp:Transcript_2397/g.6721  ORF Transcript_2397/g.6721 Transcript_2397/m.6721 type:complete len:85 (-) Transcript_2397:1199-1453(-)